MPIPAPYDNPPTIDGKLFGVFIRAFNQLSQERRPSEINGKNVTVHRISYRDLREFAQFNGYDRDPEFMEELTAYVRALDTVWIELEVKRLKRGTDNGKP